MNSPSNQYTVLVSKVAGRDLKRLQKIQKILDDRLFRRIDATIQDLAKNLRPPSCEPIKGMAGAYRVREGDYRIVYAVDDNAKDVKIVHVGDRKDVYKH